MSLMALSIPVGLMISMGAVGLSPKSKNPKFVMDVGTVAIGLFFGLPLSVAMFPSLAVKNAKECEPEFQKHDQLYYNRGM